MSRVPMDRTDIYAMEASQPNIYDIALGILQEDQKITQAAADEFGTALDKLYTELPSGTPLQDEFRDATYAHMTNLKEQFKTVNTRGFKDTDENKKKRLDLWGQIESSNKQVGELENSLTNITALNKNNLINTTATTAPNLEAITELVKKDGKTVDYSWDENNKLMLSITTPNHGVVDISSDELMNSVVPHAMNEEAALLEGYAGYEKAGYSATGKFDDATIRDDISRGILSDKRVFSDLATRRLRGFGESYREALLKNPEIHAILTDLGGFNYDGSTDGVVNEADFATPENQTKIIDALTNIKSDNFNWDVARTTAADFFMRVGKQKFTDSRTMFEEHNVQQSGIVGQFPGLGAASYVYSPFDGEKKWVNPQIKQAAVMFFGTPQQDGATYEGQHAYYVQTPTKDGSTWLAYKSLDDYKKKRKSIGSYTTNELLGAEAGISGFTGSIDWNNY